MIWSILAYIIIGFLGGAIAKAILPGEQGGGFVATTLLGIVGAFVGGFLGGMLLDSSYTDVFSIAGLITSIVGAIVVLLIWGLIRRNKK